MSRRGRSTTPPSSGSSKSASGGRRRTSRPGGAARSATSPAPCGWAVRRRRRLYFRLRPTTPWRTSTPSVARPATSSRSTAASLRIRYPIRRSCRPRNPALRSGSERTRSTAADRPSPEQRHQVGLRLPCGPPGVPARRGDDRRGLRVEPGSLVLMALLPEDVEFESAGSTIRGWLFRPGVSIPGPAVVMAHGLSAVKEMFLDVYAEAFAGAGMTTLVYDLSLIHISEP